MPPILSNCDPAPNGADGADGTVDVTGLHNRLHASPYLSAVAWGPSVMDTTWNCSFPLVTSFAAEVSISSKHPVAFAIWPRSSSFRSLRTGTKHLRGSPGTTAIWQILSTALGKFAAPLFAVMVQYASLPKYAAGNDHVLRAPFALLNWVCVSVSSWMRFRS